MQEGIVKGREEGVQEGIVKGRERINVLNQKLKEDNRLDDLLKAVSDVEYQNQLLAEYGI